MGSVRGAARVLLIGLMGSGKTSVGIELARRLGCPYLDNDRLLQEETGLSLRTLFESRGAAQLHEREWQIFTEILDGSGAWVASAAASVVADPRTAPALRRREIWVVWLRAHVQTLVSRIGEAHERPLLDHNPRATLTRMMEERGPVYQRLSSLVVDVDDASVGQIARSIEASLAKRVDSGGAARNRRGNRREATT
jgi:shikimate kinase